MPLTVKVPDIHGWDPVKEEFVDYKAKEFVIEHSLISIQKWESKWHKPYLSEIEHTPEEAIDYIRCMTITPGVEPDLYNYLPESEIVRIANYINDPMTATTFSNNAPPGTPVRKKEIITAEIVYYLMIELGIPMEFRKWHFNQLQTLIKVCQIKNGGSKKMTRSEVLAQNRELNAARRAKYKKH